MIYCGECGMPPEYCEYGPDFESHCNPWLLRKQPDLYNKLHGNGEEAVNESKEVVDSGPTRPWTTEERLTAYYSKYQRDKLDDVPVIMEKYKGKEEKLFLALVRKYGPEPNDPFDKKDEGAGDSDDEFDNIEDMAGMSIAEKKKRRGASAKKVNKVETRVVIHKIIRNKRKVVTCIIGMDTAPNIKLKEVSKAFSKRFAGSSSVKDMPNGKKEIIIQGDHMEDVAAMIVDKFKIPAVAVFMDVDGEFIPYK